METVENKYITVAYKLYSIENGEKDFEEEAPVEHPFQFISGLGMTLEPFEAQIKDLQIGDKFDFTIPASEAYGEYDDDHVIDLPKEIFMIEGEFDSDRVVEGAVIPLMTSEGQRINGSVVEVKEDVVVMDMNHPLAGCDLNFTGEVVESRPATNEELAEVARMMGGGCGSCGCGDCGDGCGDHVEVDAATKELKIKELKIKESDYTVLSMPHGNSLIFNSLIFKFYIIYLSLSPIPIYPFHSFL